MKITVMLVEPEYEKNIGYVCRVISNFGHKYLVIVNPKCKIGKDAVKYSKHGVKILKKAKIVKSFKKEIKDYDFIIGSTAVKTRNRDTIRDILPLRSFVKGLDYYKGKKVLLVVGREGIGLNKKEISECDVMISIESSESYPTLNISHALAIMLYEISKKRLISKEIPVEKGEKEALFRLFKKMAKKGKNPELALTCFRRIVGRARIKKKEAIMLLEIFGKYV